MAVLCQPSRILPEWTDTSLHLRRLPPDYRVRGSSMHSMTGFQAPPGRLHLSNSLWSHFSILEAATHVPFSWTSSLCCSHLLTPSPHPVPRCVFLWSLASTCTHLFPSFRLSVLTKGVLHRPCQHSLHGKGDAASSPARGLSGPCPTSSADTLGADPGHLHCRAHPNGLEQPP